MVGKVFDMVFPKLSTWGKNRPGYNGHGVMTLSSASDLLSDAHPRPAISLALLSLAGATIGFSHWDARLWPLAWLGMVVMGGILSRDLSWRVAAVGLFLGGVLQHWVGHPWHWDSMTLYLPKGTQNVMIGAIAFTTIWVAVLRLPLFLAWLAARRFKAPVWLWLPPAWLAGESLWNAGTALSHGDWLYTQWRVEPVLRLLHGAGWEATTLLCLAAATALGGAMARRSPRPLAVCGLALLALGLAPALPTTSAAVFEGVGAVTMSQHGRLPRVLPDGLSLVLWPEVASPRRPRLPEGASGMPIAPPVKASQAIQLVGLHTRGERGGQNVIAAIGPDNRVIAARAKERLFPITETPLFGYMVPHATPAIAGRAGPMLAAGGRRYASLVCLEALDRHLARVGRQAGAEMLVVSASDRVLAGSRLGMEQVLATAVMRAVETGLPVVRASIAGSGAFILPNGQVVARTEPGQDGVLTARGEVPSFGRPFSLKPGQTPATVEAAVIYSNATPDLQAALPIGRCAYFPIETFHNPGVRAKTVVVGGHSLPPNYLDRPADEVARAIASFEPELVVLDTCYGASSPILRALATAGSKARVVAPAFRIPQDGFVYGPAFLDTPDPARRASLVRTEPVYPLLDWQITPAALNRLDRQVAGWNAAELRARLKRAQPPLVRAELPDLAGPAARVLVPVPVERFRHAGTR